MKQIIMIGIIAVLALTGTQAFAHCQECDKDVEVDIFATAETEDSQPCTHRNVAVDLGLVLGSEMDSAIFTDDPAFADEFLANKMPGFFVEVIHGNIGYGFTGLVRFTDTASTYPNVAQEWHLYWIGSLDFKYHFFGTDSFIDPTVGFGIGCAGSMDLPVRDAHGMEYQEAQVTGLSIFGQAACGFALNFDGVVVGAKAAYRFHNEAPPATSFAPVAIADFQYSISVAARL